MQDLKRTGRPRTTTAREDRKIVRRYRKVWRKDSVGRRGIDRELKKKGLESFGKNCLPKIERSRRRNESETTAISPHNSPQKIVWLLRQTLKKRTLISGCGVTKLLSKLELESERCFNSPEDEELEEIQYGHLIFQNVRLC